MREQCNEEGEHATYLDVDSGGVGWRLPRVSNGDGNCAGITCYS